MKFAFILYSLFFLLKPVLGQAAESVRGFDDIVNELKIQKRKLPPPMYHDPLDEVLIHVGISYCNSYYQLRGNDGLSTERSQGGLGLNLGIDLFNPDWVAEGGFRNYGQQTDRAYQTTLREFDFRLIYHPIRTQFWTIRTGAGLSARYLELDDRTKNLTQNSTTPSALFILGIESYMTRAWSLGVDISARSALIADSIDRASGDLNVRMNHHF